MDDWIKLTSVAGALAFFATQSVKDAIGEPATPTQNKLHRFVLRAVAVVTGAAVAFVWQSTWQAALVGAAAGSLNAVGVAAMRAQMRPTSDQGPSQT